jgi:hypothetical protein
LYQVNKENSKQRYLPRTSAAFFRLRNGLRNWQTSQLSEKQVNFRFFLAVGNKLNLIDTERRLLLRALEKTSRNQMKAATRPASPASSFELR